jgi:hypothetical protein
MHRGRLAFCLTLALFVVATIAAPSSADMPTPYSANFPQELTVQTTCPPGVPPPPASFCFTGSDHSARAPRRHQDPTHPPAEDFTGFVDFTSPIANACPPNPGSMSKTTGFPDHNQVTIGTYVAAVPLTE